MTVEYGKILKTALKAARVAGRHLKKSFLFRSEVEFKGEIDLITQRDRESQQIIHQIIKKNFPRHSILGEENLEIQKSREHLWLIDPIDGTTNFVHQLPFFSISIAYLREGEIKTGVVYNPRINELFWATAKGGAFLNKKRITVSRETDLQKSFLATGFPYDIRESAENNLNYFNTFILKALAIRRCGSAAIDLAYTAAGRFDGFWELKLNPWDTAAGALLVTEAGGKITNFSGQPFDPFEKECVASNQKIHQQILDIISKIQEES
jgi:myo-inositol-1(or 4)-monophosphatase